MWSLSTERFRRNTEAWTNELNAEWAKTPAELLELIGRDAPKRLGERAGTWEELTAVFREGTEPLKEAGVSVQDRK